MNESLKTVEIHIFHQHHAFGENPRVCFFIKKFPKENIARNRRIRMLFPPQFLLLAGFQNACPSSCADLFYSLSVGGTLSWTFYDSDGSVWRSTKSYNYVYRPHSRNDSHICNLGFALEKYICPSSGIAGEGGGPERLFHAKKKNVSKKSTECFSHCSS